MIWKKVILPPPQYSKPIEHILTAWFQVSQLPHFSSPLIAAAEPVQPADKSARKSSTPKVNQFGIFISATLCSDGP